MRESAVQGIRQAILEQLPVKPGDLVYVVLPLQSYKSPPEVTQACVFGYNVGIDGLKMILTGLFGQSEYDLEDLCLDQYCMFKHVFVEKATAEKAAVLEWDYWRTTNWYEVVIGKTLQELLDKALPELSFLHECPMFDGNSGGYHVAVHGPNGEHYSNYNELPGILEEHPEAATWRIVEAENSKDGKDRLLWCEAVNSAASVDSR